MEEFLSLHRFCYATEYSTFLIFPILFSIYGVLIASYDFKHKTLKVKAVNEKWYMVTLAKIFSMIMGGLMAVFISFTLAFIFGNFLYANITKGLPVTEFNIVDFSNLSITFSSIAVTGSIALLFALIGFTLAYIMKGSIIPITTVVVYNMFIPVLGKFDLKNVVSYIGHKVYYFNGSFKLFNPIEISVSESVLYMIITYLLLLSSSIFLSQKQSKFI